MFSNNCNQFLISIHWLCFRWLVLTDILYLTGNIPNSTFKPIVGALQNPDKYENILDKQDTDMEGTLPW